MKFLDNVINQFSLSQDSFFTSKRVLCRAILVPEVERSLIRQIFFFFISYPKWSEKKALS